MMKSNDEDGIGIGFPREPGAVRARQSDPDLPSLPS